MAQYQQVDASASTGLLECGSGQDGTFGRFWKISAGAAAGSVSRSATVKSGGAAVFTTLYYRTSAGVPGTASWVGACTMRLNITTANSNITWAKLLFCEAGPSCGGLLTTTSGLAIGLGTSGVKTASAEASGVWTMGCGTATGAASLELCFSNGATMNAIFNYVNDQLVDLPFTSSAAPAPSAIFTLAQMNVGQ